jgi:hypothetical protein
MDVLKISCLVIFAVIAGVVHGQERPPFENLSIDRPDVSNLPVTVLPGHYQVEWGVEYDKNDYSREWYLPNVLIRTGLSKKTELRFGANVIRLDSTVALEKSRLTGFSLSAKHRFFEEKGLRPAIAFQPGINYLVARHDQFPKHEWAFDFILLFNNTFHRQVFLNYNLGFYLIGMAEKRLLASASLSFLHTHRLGYFLEGYTLRTWQERSNFSFDGGFTYLLSPRLQIDAYAGKRWAIGSSYKFVGCGMGFRIDRDDLKPRTFKEIGIHH